MPRRGRPWRAAEAGRSSSGRWGFRSRATPSRSSLHLCPHLRIQRTPADGVNFISYKVTGGGVKIFHSLKHNLLQQSPYSPYQLMDPTTSRHPLLPLSKSWIFGTTTPRARCSGRAQLFVTPWHETQTGRAIGSDMPPPCRPRARAQAYLHPLLAVALLPCFCFPCRATVRSTPTVEADHLSSENHHPKWRIGELSSQETQHMNQNLLKKQIKPVHHHQKRPRNHLTSSNLAL
jgi:hypothetical protein